MNEETLKLALHKAFDLGSKYWQQADSEYSSEWKKADETKARLDQLVEETITAIKQALAAPVQGPDPCPGCRKGVVCKTPSCERLKLPADHPYRTTPPAAPMQEPVAQDVQEKCRIEAVPAKGGLLPAAPTVQEPVAWPMEEQPDGSIIPVDPSELPSDYFTTPPAGEKPTADIMALAEKWRTAGCKAEHAALKDQLRRAVEALRGPQVLALTTPPAAPVQEPKQSPPFTFRRFVAGSERAQDVAVHREITLDAAIRVAAKICPPSESGHPTVLVYTPPPPAQPAVPLTDEQADAIALDVMGFAVLDKEQRETARMIIRNTEAAHGITEKGQP
jgi:hypothetical protein